MSLPITTVRTCTKCGDSITDFADIWPGNKGTICTDCWEKSCSEHWWACAPVFASINRELNRRYACRIDSEMKGESMKDEFCPACGKPIVTYTDIGTMKLSGYCAKCFLNAKQCEGCRDWMPKRMYNDGDSFCVHCRTNDEEATT